MLKVNLEIGVRRYLYLLNVNKIVVAEVVENNNSTGTDVITKMIIWTITKLV